MLLIIALFFEVWWKENKRNKKTKIKQEFHEFELVLKSKKQEKQGKQIKLDRLNGIGVRINKRIIDQERKQRVGIKEMKLLSWKCEYVNNSSEILRMHLNKKMQDYLSLTLNKMQRRYWSQQEDQSLKNIVQSMPEMNWTLVSHRMRHLNSEYIRNAKQCRERWINKLNRCVSADRPWSSSQDRIILQQYLNHHNLEKNKWIIISQKLNYQPNQSNSASLRTPNDIKNRFYSVMRKGIRRINNQLGRPVMPQEIRLLKPTITSKLFEILPQQESHEFLEIVYNMSTDFPELSIYSQEISRQKLRKALTNVMDISRKERKEQEKENEQRNCTVELKKRKSSLSTIQEQKIDHLKETMSSTGKNFRLQQIKMEYDMIDIYFRDIVDEQMSLQFEEVQFGF